jgi:hypothetical protein
MKRVLAACITVLLSSEVASATAAAQVPQQKDVSTAPSRFVLPRNTFGDAAQSPPARKPSTAARTLIRRMLIAAAVGGALGFSLGTAGDCGACGGDRVKAVLSGAMYGAMIGAAIRIHPSRRPRVDPNAKGQRSRDEQARCDPDEDAPRLP